MSTPHEKLKKLVSLATSVTGSIGGVLMARLAGDEFAGAATGPILTFALDCAADHYTRSTSRRETEKIGAGLTYALNAIIDRLEKEETPREDFLFGTDGNRSPAQQLLDGVLVKCRDEHEDSKARYIANIFANAAFLQVSFPLCNQVLRIAEILSYRQMCIVSLVSRQIELGFDARVWGIENLRAFAQETEVMDVEMRGFLKELYEVTPQLLSYTGDGVTTKGPTDDGTPTEMGKVCIELMGLDTIPTEHLLDLVRKFGGIPLTRLSTGPL